MNELPVVFHKEKVYFFDERLGELRDKKTLRIIKLSSTNSEVLAFWIKKKNLCMVETAVKDIFGDLNE